MLEKIKEFVGTCYDYILDNLVLCCIIAGFLLLTVIFIIVIITLSKNIIKYKPAYNLVTEYREKYTETLEKYQNVVNYSNLLVEQKTDLSALNAKLEDDAAQLNETCNYYRDQLDNVKEELEIAKDELNKTKAELDRLHDQHSLRLSVSTRSDELTLENMLSMTKADLVKIANKRKMKGFTALNKEELANFIYNKIHGGNTVA